MVILKATSLFDGHLMDIYITYRITLVRKAHHIENVIEMERE
jgi:hypothetical protein